MKRLIFVLVCLCLMIVPVVGIKDNFQDFSSTMIGGGSPVLYGATTGEVGFVGLTQCNAVSTPFVYAGVDVLDPNIGVRGYRLLDQSFNVLTTEASLGNGRIEIKIVGGTPTFYRDGVVVAIKPVLSINPSYFCVYNDFTNMRIDNIIVGETDHHITGSLPVNWSIQRDLLNPAATGVYAWNPNTNAWVLKNSFNFYVDADKEFGSIADPYPENLKIRYMDGTVINTTVVNTVHTQVTYDLNQFLTTSTAAGVNVPDGQYMVYFDGTTDFYADTFWVISSGGIINWDDTAYPQGGTGTLSYVISDSYFDTVTYSYRVDIQDIYGVVKQTTTINAKTGTVSVPITESLYPTGVYNALLIATTKSDSIDHVMNYDTMEVTGYVYFTGYVMNAETGTPLIDATVNITQGTSTLASLSSGVGWNSSNNWLSGTPISIVTNLTGYTNDTRSITPLTAKSIALNISLMPDPATTVGVSIGGIVRDNVYGNPIPAATYHVRNGTEYAGTTNIAGFARIDSLTAGILYDVWSSKIGYGNSSIAQKLAVGV